VTNFWSLLFAFQEPAQPSRGPGGGFFLVQMALIFGIIYFLMIRPKVKKEREHREQVAQLRKGDEVITAGGIIGEIVHLKDDRVTVKSGESRFVVMRDRIASVPSASDNQERSA
jgi:preprotein translocase subunit YajC